MTIAVLDSSWCTVLVCKKISVVCAKKMSKHRETGGITIDRKIFLILVDASTEIKKILHRNRLVYGLMAPIKDILDITSVSNLQILIIC